MVSGNGWRPRLDATSSSAVAPKDGINSLSPTRDKSQGRRDRDDHSFPRQNRLRGVANFQAVRSAVSYKPRRGRWCEISVAPAREGESGSSFGIVVTSKAGNAVRRNRLKRIIREFLRNHKDAWPKSMMVMIKIRGAVTDEAGLIAEIEDMLTNLE